MKIGMLADIYKPHISGITTYISLNKSRLEQRGHEVYVFTFGYLDYQDQEARVYRSLGFPLFKTGAFLNLRYHRRAREMVQEMDVVHIHHPFFSGPVALRYCKPRGIPIIFTNHTRYDLYAQSYAPFVPSAISDTLVDAYLSTFCRMVDLVISPSEGMRKVLRQYGVNSRIDVIPNGIDLSPFNENASPIDRDQFGFGNDDVVLVYTGRLGPEKNVSFLFESFARAIKSCSILRLLVIGDGPQRERLQVSVRKLGLDRIVHFTGLVPHTVIPQYLKSADAFVTASVTEVHPYTVIEAMASGLPVVGIRSPGIADTVQEGLTGYLVDEGSLNDFSDMLVRIGMEGDLRRRMGNQARREAKHYNIENTTEMVIERYQWLVDQAAIQRQTRRLRLSPFGPKRT